MSQYIMLKKNRLREYTPSPMPYLFYKIRSDVEIISL